MNDFASTRGRSFIAKAATALLRLAFSRSGKFSSTSLWLWFSIRSYQCSQGQQISSLDTGNEFLQGRKNVKLLKRTEQETNYRTLDVLNSQAIIKTLKNSNKIPSNTPKCSADPTDLAKLSASSIFRDDGSSKTGSGADEHLKEY